jgi:hypothetical protein
LRSSLELEMLVELSFVLASFNECSKSIEESFEECDSKNSHVAIALSFVDCYNEAHPLKEKRRQKYQSENYWLALRPSVYLFF